MKAFTRISILGVLTVFLLYSCSNNKGSALKLSGDDAKDIIGIWKSEGSKKTLWIDFRPDGLYDQGFPGEVKEQNQPYELNTSNKQLVLKSEKGDRTFSYKFEDDFLIITLQGKDRAIKFEKVNVRPTGK